MNELLKDSELRFPHCMVLKASAGAGKTRALTGRYVQFLLSKKISTKTNNKLQNILAITFSNNAAKEMKERILGWLKRLYFKDKEAVDEFMKLVQIESNSEKPEDILSREAERLIKEILSNYSDFYVKTIDSFMTSLFKSCATDFGYDPDFDILMNNEELLSYSFELFLKEIKDGSKRAKEFEELIELLEDMKGSNSYLWEPDEDIFKKWRELYRQTSSKSKELILENNLKDERKEIEEKLFASMSNIKRFLDSLDSLDPQFLNKKFKHGDFRSIIEKRDFPALLTKDWKEMPVKRTIPQDIFTQTNSLWQEFQSLLSQYVRYYSLTYYQPYVERFKDFFKELERIKVQEGLLFIEDINKKLVSYLNSDIVPDIYFRLGEMVLHFLIDEFQDTSPLQWKNLFPLIENALSTYGSLFIVGDTKQAIYGFRGADYRIMKRLENEKVFPSAEFIKRELDTNYRCGGVILNLAESLFKEIIPSIEQYRYAAKLSGLSDYNQKALPEKEDRGYVEIKYLKEDKTKEDLWALIENLTARGYSYRDIAILSFRNEHVVMLSEWLNEHNYYFISYSSLDVRKRKVSSEILHLLKFLDSPIDDFSFCVFLQGEIYKNFLTKNGLVEKAVNDHIQHFLLRNRGTPRLYKSFEREFPELWKDHFEKLFKLAGYLPLYDLLSMIGATFRLYECMPDEEATFLKIFELARVFEKNGFGNIKDFIEFMTGPGEDESLWDISLPADIDAIKLMTLHKSKGLEFPVTILYLPSKINNKKDSMVSYETNQGMLLMKLTKKLGEKNEELMRIYSELEINEKTETLNLLYVGLTRAKEELYVILDEKNGEEDRETTNQGAPESFPANIFAMLDKKEKGRKLSPEEIKEIKEKTHEEITESLKISHHFVMKEFPVEIKEIHVYEKERGEFIHRILATIEYYNEGTPQDIYKTIEKLNKRSFIKFNPETIHAQVIKTIENLYPYFKELPKRRIMNEKEFSDKQGALYRMDRVVIDPALITVIDYKTGIPDEEEREEHIMQVSLYKEILREIYPTHHIKGLLFYVDRQVEVEI